MEECHYNYVSQNVPDGGVCLCVESCNHFTVGPTILVWTFDELANMATSGCLISQPSGIEGFLIWEVFGMTKCARWWRLSLCWELQPLHSGANNFSLNFWWTRKYGHLWLPNFSTFGYRRFSYMRGIWNDKMCQMVAFVSVLRAATTSQWGQKP